MKSNAINASTSDAYALELLAERIDPCVSELPTEGQTDHDGEYNYDYSYTISASVETKTVTFAGVEYGIKYVAVMLNKTATRRPESNSNITYNRYRAPYCIDIRNWQV